MEQAGITLLRDESVMIADEIVLYGRPDAKKPGRGITVRRTPGEITSGLDLSKPIFVIDHEPGELQELADAGADLDLCGHTHDGQMFPGNILTAMMWENACGYLKKDDMHSIVTSGSGGLRAEYAGGNYCGNLFHHGSFQRIRGGERRWNCWTLWTKRGILRGR